MKEVNSYINLKDTTNIRLNGNESYFNIDKELTYSMSSLIGKVEFNRYPENSSEELRKAYAEYIGVDKKNIIVGNGSDEMINLLITSTISKGKKILTLDPDFSMYDFYASLSEGILVKQPITAGSAWNVDEFIKLGRKENVDLVIFSNPNNPTGLGIELDDIEKILVEFKDKMVVVDEAYYEFYGVTAISLINKYKNLFVTRTLSKAWGLAALRVGFLISNEEEIQRLSRFKVPYNVNSISQKMALEILKGCENFKEKVEAIVTEREILYKELKNIEKEAALDIKFYPSKGNFIYGETSYKDALIKPLENKGIIIRNFEGEAFRISVGAPIENKKLVEVIKDSFVY